MLKTAIATIISVIIIGIAIFLSSGNETQISVKGIVQNVHMVDGVQIIELGARGGYSPRVSKAKAGVPTKIRFNTSGTFDCSASVRIPSLELSTMLPNSGSTDVDLGTPAAGVLQGSCGMGMYPFEITFEN